jgi:predicted nucleic acid-binding Zn ribbon protein
MTMKNQGRLLKQIVSPSVQPCDEIMKTMKTAQMSLANVQKSLAAVGISFFYADGEYRVNFRKGGEGTAYYTDDQDRGTTPP